MSKPTMKIGGVTVPQGLTQKELLKFLVENKSILIAEKRSAIKYADAIEVGSSIKYFVDKEGKLNKGVLEETAKAEMGGPETVLCVINTTNWMDSHSDVHMPGIWSKSIKENKSFLHLQEHQMKFTNIISDEAKGYTESMSWKDLGLDLPGVTEALIFATPLSGRNEYMEEQYRKGFVKNHSVGMRYVVIKLCVNEPEDEWYKEEYANWVTYSPKVANLVDAEAQGYFWAVLEAQIIEGSAVPKGSNIITPTIGFKSVQPAVATEKNEPPEGTQVKEVNWDKVGDFLLQS